MKRLLLLPFLVLSCAVNNDEVDGEVFCSIDQTDTYQLGANPTGDFNVTNIVKTRVFNNTDCPNINNDSFEGFVSRAKRVGNNLEIYERQYQSSQQLLEFQLSGTTIEPVRRHVNVSNCSIIREWDGTLNSPGNTITLNETVIYKGVCRSTFYNPDLDTTNPGG